MPFMCYDLKLQCDGDQVSKGRTMFNNLFFPVRYNAKSRGLNPNSGQNKTDHGTKNMIIIKFSSVLNKTIEIFFI